MKKILLLFMMCALLPVAGRAQGTPTEDTFTVSDLTWDSEMDGYYFIVSLEGSQFYTAYNLDIFLPNGVNVMYDAENGYYVIEETELYVYNKIKKTYSHRLVCEMPSTHQLRVACYSESSTNFTSTEGTLFYVYVTLDNTILSSSFSPKPIVKLSGMNLTTSSEVKYVPADFACRPFTTGIPTSRTLSVNVSAENKIGTLILPFNASLPSGLKAYTCNALDGDLLTLTPAASIEACTPYIVYAENGYSGNLTGTAELTDGTNVTDIFADGYLTGVLTGTTVNTGYILQNQGEGPMFYDAEGATFSLPAGRCYLTPPPSGDVKAFCFSFDTETAIQDKMVNGKSVNGKLYDLCGRRVEAPTRGIYIQGSRKLVVK